MNAPSLKQFALSCASVGWFIFPLVAKSKVPDGNLAPQGFKSASNDPQQIEKWWTISPDANAGVDLGRSGLTVLDFDKGEPPAELAPFLKGRYTVKTARGLHVYLRGVAKQQKMYFKGVHVGEIKSDGGYVLAPFSVHPDGPVYTVVVDGNVGPLPEELVKLVAAPHEALDASLDGPKIPRGQHDITLYRIACKMRQMGLEQDAIYNALIEICEKRCENYGSDYRDMCTRKAQQACKYSPGTEADLIFSQQPQSIPLQQSVAITVDVSNWRSMFRSIGEMEDGPIDEIIKGVLQEGICFIGANPADGKTLTSLAFAKAICTGTPLFGLQQFPVEKPRTVIYLIPESRDRAFRKRCETFRLPDDKTKFMCRTTSAGPSLALGDPYLMEAVRETKAVVFLDTASRFMNTTDENSAAQNRMLMNDVQALLAAGAVCVVLIHHATKASQGEAMTLENMLRGTGDFAAMCDQAYGIRKDRTLYASGNGPMEIDIISLKDREQIGSLTTLRLAASRLNKSGSIFPTVSIIDETGNFKVVSNVETSKRETDSIESLVKRNPTISIRSLAQELGSTEYKVESSLQKLGWHRVRGGKGGSSPWHQDNGQPCPYTRVPVAVETSGQPTGEPVAIG